MLPANVVLTVLAVMTALYFASAVVVPIALALYLNILLSPLVTIAERARIPAALTAGIVVIGIVSSIFLSVNLLADPAQDWYDRAPKIFNDIQRKILPLTEPLEGISDIASSVDEITTIDAKEKENSVTLKGPNLFEQIAEELPEFLLSLAIVLFLCYFFLSAGDNFLRKLVSLGTCFSERRRIFLILRDIQQQVSRYLLTVTAINLALGLLVTLAMLVLEVPNPMLWGALAASLNFIPYLGAVVMAIILAMVGLATFENPAEIFSPVMVYMLLSIVEGNLITPALLGRRLSLQPSVILMMLVFWGWMWGIVGAFLSVPITIALKVVMQRSPQFQKFSKLLQR